MSLPASPPASTPRSVREGDKGWPVFALQSALNDAFSVSLTEDGAFGPKTTAAVKAFQTSAKLTADGIAGPATEKKLVLLLDERVHGTLPALPVGIMRGFAESEGGNRLAAVNWAVAGGVDCGVMQYRCFGPPYSSSGLQLAFSPLSAMQLTGNGFLSRASYLGKLAYASKQPREFTLRCAAMAHNWPVAGGAETIAKTGKCSNPDGACTWLPRNSAGELVCRFKGSGRLVKTRWDWCTFYALGSKADGHPGQVTQYVTDWS